MKTILLSIALLITAPLILTTTGCKAPTAVRAYKSLAVTQQTVDTARRAFLAAYDKGQVDQATAVKAVKASERFNRLFNAAVLTSKSLSAEAPFNVAEAAADFIALVQPFIK